MSRIAGIIYITFIFLVAAAGYSSCAEKAEYWKRFNPGSWALYDLSDGLQKRVNLTNKTDSEITLKVEMIKEGKVVGSSEEETSLDSDTESAVPVKAGMLEYVQDTLVVNQVIACKVYEYNTNDGVQKMWFSEQIPGGLVKSATDDTITLELTDYQSKYYLTK